MKPAFEADVHFSTGVVKVGTAELTFRAEPAGGVNLEALYKTLGNRIDERDGKAIITHEAQDLMTMPAGLLLDHSEAAPGELVWACETCGAYSRSQAIVEGHEKGCGA